MLLLILKKNLLETLSQCQTIWIPIRTTLLFKINCKDYKQTTKVAAGMERGEIPISSSILK